MAAVTPVLMASGDEGLRAHVRLTLGDERFALHEAVDSDGALHVIAAERPQLLLLDLALPGAGALVIASTLRARNAERPHVLLLVPSGRTAPEDAAGVDAVLTMPATSYALLRKVDAMLEG